MNVVFCNSQSVTYSEMLVYNVTLNYTISKLGRYISRFLNGNLFNLKLKARVCCKLRIKPLKIVVDSHHGY